MRIGRGHAIAALAVMGLALPAAPAASAQDSDAVSGFESAGNLLRKCRENSAFARNYCYAYLAAVADAARSYRVWIGSGDPCLPERLTMGQLADIFEAHLIANPSLTDAQAASVIVAGLQERYPCPVLAPPALPGPPIAAPSAQPVDQRKDPAPQGKGQSQQ